jgi:hypothetical protein
LADKLKEIRGEEFKADTIGKHVKKNRFYRMGEKQKGSKFDDKVLRTEGKAQKNVVFKCDLIGLDKKTSDFTIPETSTTSHTSYSSQPPHSLIMGGILSSTDQIAVANSARMKDADFRRKRFSKLYLQHQSLPDKERKEIIKKEMGISDRTYYYKKKECEEELDRLCQFVKRCWREP